MNKYIIGYTFDGKSKITWVYADSEEEARWMAQENHPYAKDITVLCKKEM